MAVIDWVILCDRTTVDAEGAVSLHHIFTRVAATSLPVAIDFAIAMRVTGRAGERVDLAIEVQGPDGGPLYHDTPAPAALSDGGERIVTMEMAGVFDAPGLFAIVVAVSGDGGDRRIVGLPVTQLPGPTETRH